MKKLLVWCLVLTMVISTVVFPVSAFATETTEDTTTEGTETTEPEEVVHFNNTWEGSTTTLFPPSKTLTYGTFARVSGAGSVVDGIDGKAFHFSLTSASGKSATYTPTTALTSGKVLISADIKYNMSGSKNYTKWRMKNSGATKYLLSFENPADSYGASVYTAVGGDERVSRLFKAEEGKVYTIDIVLDLDAGTQTYYVNGEYKYSYNLKEDYGITAFSISEIAYGVSANIDYIDNFKLIQNPKNYSFTATNTTTEEKCITVRFSDSVSPEISDFTITENAEEGAEAKTLTVTDIETVNGRIHKLKFADVTPGEYTITLDSEKTTVAGATPSATTATFTVTPEYTYFDVDFENFTSGTGQTYLNANHKQYGSWGSDFSNLSPSNTYKFAGDTTNGAYATGTGKANYAFSDTINSGVLKISFDAAFDYTQYSSRDMVVYLNNDQTNASTIMGYTNTSGGGGGRYIKGATTNGKVNDGAKQTDFVDNQPYRWDIIVDIDNKTIKNYKDGVCFSTVTGVTSSYILNPVNIGIRLTKAISFFDNFKVTLNVDDFGYTASDIDTYSNSTIINFDDTMVFDDVSTAMEFTDPYGYIVTPTSVTKISPRKYKAAFSAVDLVAGEYKVTLADGITTSAIGNTVKIESASFTVAERPEDTFFAKNLDFAEVEGGVSLSTTLTNWGEDTENPEEALLVIAVYDGNELVECVADSFDIASGDTDIEKSITLTTAKDLSQYTVRGFVWDIGEEFYSLYEPATK